MMVNHARSMLTWCTGLIGGRMRQHEAEENEEVRSVWAREIMREDRET